MYLLDTDIVFELRNAKAGGPDPGLAGWAAGVARSSLFISAVTLLELETGVARVERKDKAAGAALRTWLGGPGGAGGAAGGRAPGGENPCGPPPPSPGRAAPCR